MSSPTAKLPEPAGTVSLHSEVRWLFISRKLLGFLLVVALTFLALLAMTFFIGRFIPIDPVLSVVGDRASNEVYEAARVAMGLNRPLPLQYLSYAGEVLTGDLGRSVSTNREVISNLARVFPATLEMATIGIIIGVFIGVPMGVFAASRQGSWVDHIIRMLAVSHIVLPAFIFGFFALAYIARMTCSISSVRNTLQLPA